MPWHLRFANSLKALFCCIPSCSPPWLYQLKCFTASLSQSFPGATSARTLSNICHPLPVLHINIDGFNLGDWTTILFDEIITSIKKKKNIQTNKKSWIQVVTKFTTKWPRCYPAYPLRWSSSPANFGVFRWNDGEKPCKTNQNHPPEEKTSAEWLGFSVAREQCVSHPPGEKKKHRNLVEQFVPYLGPYKEHLWQVEKNGQHMPPASASFLKILEAFQIQSEFITHFLVVGLFCHLKIIIPVKNGNIKVFTKPITTQISWCFFLTFSAQQPPFEAPSSPGQTATSAGPRTARRETSARPPSNCRAGLVTPGRCPEKNGRWLVLFKNNGSNWQTTFLDWMEYFYIIFLYILYKQSLKHSKQLWFDF